MTNVAEEVNAATKAGEIAQAIDVTAEEPKGQCGRPSTRHSARRANYQAMNANILIKAASRQSLETFVADLPQAIGLEIWKERQSSNYFGESYFQSLSLGIEVIAALADDAEFQGFEFWLLFKPEPGCRGETEFLDGLADCVARKLAQKGYEAIRPFNMGREGSGGMIYRPNPQQNAKPPERVITEEI